MGQMIVRDAVVYGLALVGPGIKVRDAVVYGASVTIQKPQMGTLELVVLQTEAGVAQLGTLELLVLQSEPQDRDYSVAPRDALLNAINSEFGKSFTTATLSIGSPQVVPGDDPANSKVSITALPGSQLSGSMDIYYNRRDISDLFSQINAAGFSLAGHSSVHGLLNAFNTQFGLAITPEEFVDSSITGGQTSITVTAAPTSIWFYPGTQAVLGA